MVPAVEPNKIEADVLIVGSGLAGLLLALRLQAQGASVALATKGLLADSNSSFAQGGVAAVTGANPFDSPQTHLVDTLKAGAGLCDAQAAGKIIFGGERLIAELAGLGVAFDKNPSGGLDLALEGGHKQARVLHRKDTTGQSITSALAEKIRQVAADDSAFYLLEETCAVDLLKSSGVCRGAKFIDCSGDLLVYARHTVLATGGLGQIFERTTNPAVATGDGVALAYRAGARLADMEFVQFHPTALKKDNAPAFLISEAVRGAGATMLDHKGRRFVGRFHQDGELATRDVVSRAIHSVMREHDLQHVYLDLRPIGADLVSHKFPNIVKTCAAYGIDVLSQPIPIAPAAHYMMGGIEADTTGRTSVKGLYAIGECACTGLHGANRLASNSLLEAGVMALNLSDALSTGNLSLSTDASDSEVWEADRPEAGGQERLQNGAVMLPVDLQGFRTMMYRYAGLVRSEQGLSTLLNTPAYMTTVNLSAQHLAARNVFQVGLLIAQAARMRKESRGAHLREEYSSIDEDNFGRRLWIAKDGFGWEESREMLYH